MDATNPHGWSIRLAIILLGCVLVVAFGVWRQNATPKNMDRLTFTQSDFPQYGVVVITPSDPRFAAETASLLKGREVELIDLINSAQPFSVFVQNWSDVSVVGCSLVWRVEKSDGSVVSLGQSYSTPGALMGMEPMDKKMIGHTDLINKKSHAFMSLDPETKQLVDWRTKSIVPLGPLDESEKKKIKQLSLQLKRGYNEFLASTKRITVSIDAVIWSDGLFFGPDKNRLIMVTESMVDAKRDLAKRIEADLKRDEAFNSVLKRIETMPRSPIIALGASKSDEEYRNAYERQMEIYIQEILRLKEAKGEAAAIKYSQEALRKIWPTLRPKRSDSITPQ